jgi:uncharacterized protein (TIGR03437 family)
MMRPLQWLTFAAMLAATIGLLPAAPDDVHAIFNLTDPAIGPFPSDHFTVPDGSQITGRRVALPKPDCAKQPSDCDDIAILNTLDGFSLQPRIAISFDGPINPSTVTSKSILLVEFGTSVTPRLIGINEIVWDRGANRLYVTSDEFLVQHTRFALIVTKGILDTLGKPVQPSGNLAEYLASGSGDYRDSLGAGLDAAASLGIARDTIVTAGVFTTLSATAVLEKIRDQIHAAVPQPASFVNSGVRTVFQRSAVTSITVQSQTSISPPAFQDTPLFTGGWRSDSDLLTALEVVPGSVGTLAFGTFVSPNYLTRQQIIPPTATLTGTPVVQGTNTLPFCLALPSGSRPQKGWPVAIMGHYLGGSREVMFLFASILAKHGFATIAFNVVGHGYGPLGTTDIKLANAQTVTLPSGGRGLDMDGNNAIASTEGLAAIGPVSLISNADGARQAVADLMQLVRVIQVGMDVDGDGQADLDPARLYYFGSSLGGIYGTIFVALEPAIRAGAPAFAGFGPDLFRLGAFRSQVGGQLQTRTPSLINSPGISQIWGLTVPAPYFNENKPLRNLPPVINDAPGATEIQRLFDYQLWARQSANPAAYAPYLRKNPRPGTSAKPMLILLAKGDQTVPVPTGSTIVRAGDLAGVTTYLRFDLAFSRDPKIPNRNPHIINAAISALNGPTAVAIATGLQEQVATFFETDGARITHPNPAEFFEVPIKLPLPENIEFVTGGQPAQAPVDAAIYETALSPGSLFTIFGPTNTVTGERSAGPGQLPATLGGVMVSINGKPAPLIYVGPNQINGQVPYETAPADAFAQVIVNGLPSAQVPFAVRPAAPRLFNGQTGTCVAHNENGALNTEANPTKAGRYVAAVLIGLGAVNPPVPTGAPARAAPYSVPPDPVSVSIGGRKLAPAYVGMIPGYVGLAMVQAMVPPDLAAGLQSFSVTVGTAPSNTCRIAVTK